MSAQWWSSKSWSMTMMLVALSVGGSVAGCAGSRAASAPTTEPVGSAAAGAAMGTTVHVCPCAAAAGAGSQLEPAGPARVYQDNAGRQLVIVALAPAQQQRYLIRFRGVAGEWNGKIVMHQHENGGADGESYTALVGGRPWPSVIVHEGGDGVQQLQVRPKGAGGQFMVHYAEAASASVKATDVIAAYEKQ